MVEIEKVETIVTESLTRHLKDMGVNDLISEKVVMCQSKAVNVIISSIIKRDDDEEICVKAEIVNANIKYQYLNHSKVSTINNDNLYDRKYRVQDGVV